MTKTDWLVLVLTLCAIVLYGLYKSRTTKNLEGYFLSNRSLPWYIVLLSIMGTQASAITFLSGPGQAYADGMRFVQYYFGLPLAMVVISITFVPSFNKLKVFTAYEFLEKRFDVKTRTFTSFLKRVQFGLILGLIMGLLAVSLMIGAEIRKSEKKATYNTAPYIVPVAPVKFILLHPGSYYIQLSHFASYMQGINKAYTFRQ